MTIFPPCHQTTKYPVFIANKGLHNGCPVKLGIFPRDKLGFLFLPLPSRDILDTLETLYVNTGEKETQRYLAFLLEKYESISASYKNVVHTHLATTLRNPHGENSQNHHSHELYQNVSMVEHLLAACYALGITGGIFCLSGNDMPILDGSSLQYAMLLKKGELRQYPDIHIPFIVPRKELFYTFNGPLPSIDHWNHKEPYISLKPGKPSFSLELHHHTLREKAYFYLLQDDFFTTIGPARTFCWEKDIEKLQTQGYGLGGNSENIGILNNEGVLINPSAIAQECAKHKILDLMGDFSLCGHYILGAIYGYNPSHALNIKVLEYFMNSQDFLQQ